MCMAGLPSTIVDTLQHGGRAIRNTQGDALFVIFYESWALGIAEDEYQDRDLTDPDRPQRKLKQTSQHIECAPLASVQLVNCEMCLRAFFAQYLNNTSAAGKY